MNQIGEDNLREVTQELCDAFSLKSFVEGRLVPDKLTAKQVFSAINIGAARSSLARRITSDALISCIPLSVIDSDPSILRILEKIKGYRTQDIGSVRELVKIGKIEKRKRDGSSEGDRSRKTTLNKRQKEIRKRVVTQIKRLAIAMSDFIYMTKEREHCIGQVIQTKEANFFQTVTGITIGDFNKLCKLGFIRKEKLNSIVRDFYHQEVASLKSDEFVAKSIISRKKSQ
ncbi:MAG TPA: hypothetical protein VKY27_02890 [Bacteriovoracaceae bacterium]|nr:hypothetical protein [Bacteriovoracaceae bacterium]